VRATKFVSTQTLKKSYMVLLCVLNLHDSLLRASRFSNLRAPKFTSLRAIILPCATKFAMSGTINYDAVF